MTSTKFWILMIAVILAANWAGMKFSKPAYGCNFRFCRDRATTTKTSPITNTHRQRVGDLYSPGHGRRVQIRDNNRRIIGYIETDGDVSSPRRKKIGEIK